MHIQYDVDLQKLAQRGQTLKQADGGEAEKNIKN